MRTRTLEASVSMAKRTFVTALSPLHLVDLVEDALSFFTFFLNTKGSSRLCYVAACCCLSAERNATLFTEAESSRVFGIVSRKVTRSVIRCRQILHNAGMRSQWRVPAFRLVSRIHLCFALPTEFPTGWEAVLQSAVKTSEVVEKLLEEESSSFSCARNVAGVSVLLAWQAHGMEDEGLIDRVCFSIGIKKASFVTSYDKIVSLL